MPPPHIYNSIVLKNMPDFRPNYNTRISINYIAVAIARISAGRIAA